MPHFVSSLRFPAHCTCHLHIEWGESFPSSVLEFKVSFSFPCSIHALFYISTSSFSFLVLVIEGKKKRALMIDGCLPCLCITEFQYSTKKSFKLTNVWSNSSDLLKHSHCLIFNLCCFCCC